MQPDRTQNTETTVQQASATPQAPTQAPSKKSLQLKSALRGRSFDEQVQMLAPGGEGDAGHVHAHAAAGMASGGGRLPHVDAIQKSFGRHDVSNVQAHQGSAASAATAGMGANAYASGNHVVLGDKGGDLHTVAHEAAHVVQQRAGVQLSGGVGKSGDAYEQHADKVADQVVQGKSVEGLLDTMAGGGAGPGVQQSAVQQSAVQRKDGDKTPEPTPTETKDSGDGESAKTEGPKKKWNFFGGKKDAKTPAQTPKHDASGFSDKEKKQISKACVAALPMVKAAIAKVAKGNSHYIKWMDNGATDTSTDGDVTARVEHVLAGLEKVKSCLENDEIKFKQYALNDGEENETYAYVQPGDVDNNIYLGGAFWSFWTWTKGKNSKAGTIIHELTHRLHATNDHAYGTGGCKSLAKKDPAKAVRNADNYEYLCETA